MALAAIYFLEREYRATAYNEISTNLNTITADLKRHLEVQHNLALGLANANAVQEYLAALNMTRLERIDSRYNIAWGRVNHYFEGFQTIVQGIYRMRLLDAQGNTLVKVSEKRRSAPEYASFNGMYYVEPELNDPRFAKLLARLPAGEVSNVIIPHNQQQSETLALLPEYDYVVPLRVGKRLVGVFALTLFGEELDRVLRYASRLYNAEVFVVEFNPDRPQRHGLVLYDDQHAIQLSQERDPPRYATALYGTTVMAHLASAPYGIFTDTHTRRTIFYQELFPYDNQLVSWVVGMRIAATIVEQPFERARLIVLIVGGVAAFINLIVASIGIHRYVGPLYHLSQRLLAFARGEHSRRDNTQSSIKEIQDLELAFNTMADSLDRAAADRDKAQRMLVQNAKLASIGQLAAGIGHELNNPLNNILSYAKLIERSLPPQSDDLRNDVRSLRDEAQRASEIVQAILNFARQVPPRMVTFSALPWLQESVSLVRESARAVGVTLAYECSEDFEIYGDRSQLQQVLINLLLNAIQASSRYDQVLLKAQTDASEVRISVIDQGTGINKEIIDKVFDPFFTTKREGSGTGLGLSISHGIIERHGGELLITNNADQGVSVVLRLPREPRHD